MNRKEILELFDYDLWANNRLFETAAQLPLEKYAQDLKASHGGIHGTLTHIVAEQKMWLGRWTGSRNTSLLQGKDVGTLLELIAIWEKVSSETAQFLSTLSDENLHQSLTITTSNGQQFTHTFQQMMQHLVNHSTGHRSQVSAMMRQLGFVPPAIDLITYYRRK
jgi:uncharacterized damage-inducible protein DinB